MQVFTEKNLLFANLLLAPTSAPGSLRSALLPRCSPAASLLLPLAKYLFNGGIPAARTWAAGSTAPDSTPISLGKPLETAGSQA